MKSAVPFGCVDYTALVLHYNTHIIIAPTHTHNYGNTVGLDSAYYYSKSIPSLSLSIHTHTSAMTGSCSVCVFEKLFFGPLQQRHSFYAEQF